MLNMNSTIRNSIFLLVAICFVLISGCIQTINPNIAIKDNNAEWNGGFSLDFNNPFIYTVNFAVVNQMNRPVNNITVEIELIPNSNWGSIHTYTAKVDHLEPQGEVHQTFNFNDRANSLHYSWRVIKAMSAPY